MFYTIQYTFSRINQYASDELYLHPCSKDFNIFTAVMPNETVVIAEIWTGTLRLHLSDGRNLLSQTVQNEKSFRRSGRTRHHCRDCA
jgi:hypothetical protein